jgi:hypothetical protein
MTLWNDGKSGMNVMKRRGNRCSITDKRNIINTINSTLSEVAWNTISVVPVHGTEVRGKWTKSIGIILPITVLSVYATT